jgi:nitrate reductase NapAB chaperone NapD
MTRKRTLYDVMLDFSIHELARAVYCMVYNQVDQNNTITWRKLRHIYRHREPDATKLRAAFHELERVGLAKFEAGKILVFLEAELPDDA